jgi:hypothetical protein
MLSFLTTQQCVVTLATLNAAIRFESVPSTESMDIDVGYPTAILEGYDSECMYYVYIYTKLLLLVYDIFIYNYVNIIAI